MNVTTLLAAIAVAVAATALPLAAAEEQACPNVCPENYSPVCGSNGVTYSNKCRLSAAACKKPSIKLVSSGKCAHKVRALRTEATAASCSFKCTQEYKPVCDSTGRKYSNACVFKLAKCKNPSLRDGACKNGAGGSAI